MAIEPKYKIEKSDLDRLSIMVTLNQLKFTIGLFENKNITDKVMIHSLDETKPDYEVEMTLSDILYFVENGTINTKPLHLVKEITDKMNEEIHFYIGKWISNSLKDSNPYESILAKMNAYKNYVNSHLIRSVVEKTLQNRNTVNQIIKEEDDNVWFYDIKKLVKYLSCRVELIKK